MIGIDYVSIKVGVTDSSDWIQHGNSDIFKEELLINIF